ncbi:MAG TPA: sporulation integral membrane protein YtvI, partial [Bacillota bacterium]|nr:sporulation integral membrane protein YtvI [Bacillota bacterium]
MNERYKKVLYYLLIAAGIALALFLVFKYALPLFLPFVLAWIVAALLQPVIRFLGDKVKIPKKISVLVLVVTAIGLLVWAVYAIANRLVTEVTSLVSFLQKWMQNIANNDSAVNNIIDWLNNVIPFIDFSDKLYEIWDNLDGYILDAIKLLSGNITDIIPVLKDIVLMIPGAVVFVVISVISCFYFACDFKKINTFLAMQLPVRARAFGTVLKQQFLITVGKYIKAYGLIILITFTELFVGFTILGISYSFLLALITALIDIMPVLGTGLVLVPWALYSLIVGDYFMGIGLLILYVLITVIRQIIEPKIVGSYIG